MGSQISPKSPALSSNGVPAPSASGYMTYSSLEQVAAVGINVMRAGGLRKQISARIESLKTEVFGLKKENKDRPIDSIGSFQGVMAEVAQWDRLDAMRRTANPAELKALSENISSVVYVHLKIKLGLPEALARALSQRMVSTDPETRLQAMSAAFHLGIQIVQAYEEQLKCLGKRFTPQELIEGKHIKIFFTLLNLYPEQAAAVYQQAGLRLQGFAPTSQIPPELQSDLEKQFMLDAGSFITTQDVEETPLPWYVSLGVGLFGPVGILASGTYVTGELMDNWIKKVSKRRWALAALALRPALGPTSLPGATPSVQAQSSEISQKELNLAHAQHQAGLVAPVRVALHPVAFVGGMYGAQALSRFVGLAGSAGSAGLAVSAELAGRAASSSFENSHLLSIVISAGFVGLETGFDVVKDPNPNLTKTNRAQQVALTMGVAVVAPLALGGGLGLISKIPNLVRALSLSRFINKSVAQTTLPIDFKLSTGRT